MRGAPTDNNATLFAQGYDAVLNAALPSGKSQRRHAPGPGPPTAESEFEQAFTANPRANSAVTPNDENAAPIITYLQNQGVKPKTFPMTGQDATLVGLQNIISGYQCGTVYKPIYLEAEAAVALAMYIRAGKTPPAAWSTARPTTREQHGSVGPAHPEVGHPANMNGRSSRTTSCPRSSSAAARTPPTAGRGHLGMISSRVSRTKRRAR